MWILLICIDPCYSTNFVQIVFEQLWMCTSCWRQCEGKTRKSQYLTIIVSWISLITYEFQTTMICMFGRNVKGKKEMLMNLFILVVNIMRTCEFQGTMVIVRLSVVVYWYCHCKAYPVFCSLVCIKLTTIHESSKPSLPLLCVIVNANQLIKKEKNGLGLHKTIVF